MYYRDDWLVDMDGYSLETSVWIGVRALVGFVEFWKARVGMKIW